MTDLTFKERDLLGGWIIEVRRGPSHIGNIRRGGTGGFVYFVGPHNQLTPEFSDADLEALKRRVANSYGR